MTRDDHIRMPPHSIEAECAVLGGLMISPASLVKIADWLTEDDFYRKDHRAIYRAVNHLASKGEPCDSVTLGEWLRANDLADLAGGTTYVIELENTTPSAANIVAYAEIVKQKADLRREIDIGTKIVGDAFAGRLAAADIASAASHELLRLAGESRLAQSATAKQAVNAWFANLHRRYEAKEVISGLTTEWADLDDATAGWQPANLYIVAARPSMGKTVFGFQAAVFNAVRSRKRTMIFSLEMSQEEVTQRAIAYLSGVDHEHLRKPALITEEEWPRITNATADFAAAPLVIDDQPGLTGDQITARAMREHMREPLTLVATDHLHEMGRPGRNEVTELADNTRAQKRMAKTLNVPALLMAQINRANTARADNRPKLADLRGSGGIEEIADVVLMLHREEYYNAETHLRNVVEVLMAKGRDLKAGDTIHLEAQLRKMRMWNWPGALPLPTFDEKPSKPTRGFAKARPRAGDSE